MAISDLTKLWEGYGQTTNAGADSLKEVYTSPWADRLTSKAELLNSRSSDFSWLFCTNVAISQIGDTASAGGPETAKLTVSWDTISSKDKQPVNNNWSDWVERWSTAGEALTVGEGYKWVSDDAVVKGQDVSAVKLFPAVQINLTGTVDNFDAAGKEFVLNCEGKVNDGTIIIKGYAYSDQTVLFMGLDSNEGVDGTSGGVVHQLGYQFNARHGHTWQEYWRKDKSGGPGWDTMSDASGGKPYEVQVFSDLDPSNW